jgi:hypothetical protein
MTANRPERHCIGLPAPANPHSTPEKKMKVINMFKVAIATAALAAISMASAHAEPLGFDYSGKGFRGTHDTVFFTLGSELKNVFLTGSAYNGSIGTVDMDFAIWKDEQFVANFRYTWDAETSEHPGTLLNAPLSAGRYALTIGQYRPYNTPLSQWMDDPVICGPDWPHCNVDYDWRMNLSGDSIGISAVPEPGTYAMLLAGLGLTGAALRRKRRLS